jgi:hypothetical protein
LIKLQIAQNTLKKLNKNNYDIQMNLMSEMVREETVVEVVIEVVDRAAYIKPGFSIDAKIIDANIIIETVKE